MPADAPPAADARDAIVAAALELLETEGYDRFKMRDVAPKARVSMTTVYRLFGSRDELVLTAMEAWLQRLVHVPLSEAAISDDLESTMNTILHAVFEPWIENPKMLVALVRAGELPGGDRLGLHGLLAADEIVAFIQQHDADAQHVEDVIVVMFHVVYAVLNQFADGRLELEEILPTFERAVRLIVRPWPSALATTKAQPATRRRAPRAPATKS